MLYFNEKSDIVNIFNELYKFNYLVKINNFKFRIYNSFLKIKQLTVGEKGP